MTPLQKYHVITDNDDGYCRSGVELNKHAHASSGEEVSQLRF